MSASRRLRSVEGGNFDRHRGPAARLARTSADKTRQKIGTLTGEVVVRRLGCKPPPVGPKPAGARAEPRVFPRRDELEPAPGAHQTAGGSPARSPLPLIGRARHPTPWAIRLPERLIARRRPRLTSSISPSASFFLAAGPPQSAAARAKEAHAASFDGGHFLLTRPPGL
jgi:hypothetical protein